MSKLTDFFPSGGGGGYTTKADVIVVGGGAGGPAGHFIRCAGGSLVNRSYNYCQIATGAGGGGQFRGCIGILAGETYPVIIGAGGAGAPAPSTAGSGVGANGSPSKFGKYIEALGGGAGATLCALCEIAPYCTNVYLSTCGGFSGGSGGVYPTSRSWVHPYAWCVTMWARPYLQFGAHRFVGYSQNMSTPCGCLYGITSPFTGLDDLSVPVIESGGPKRLDPTGTTWCPSFYCLCVANTPYTPSGTLGTCSQMRSCFSVGCTRLIAICKTCICFCMTPAANTGAGALDYKSSGDSGVVVIVYPCPFGAATSTPGAVNCTPVTGPQGYRSYKFTSSGSFTL